MLCATKQASMSVHARSWPVDVLLFLLAVLTGTDSAHWHVTLVFTVSKFGQSRWVKLQQQPHVFLVGCACAMLPCKLRHHKQNVAGFSQKTCTEAPVGLAPTLHWKALAEIFQSECWQGCACAPAIPFFFVSALCPASNLFVCASVSNHPRVRLSR